MSELILHAYDLSPFTQRVLRMLGIKGLAWHWVETPLMLPKDELVAMTGGYRGTPVLQVGSDIYIDSQLIALRLEQLHPAPSLFPVADAGLSLALGRWSDAFFRSGLRVILGLTSHSWPAAFRVDRQALFPDMDFTEAATGIEHSIGQWRADAAVLEAQLRDGRDFLLGAHPGLSDANVQPFVTMMSNAVPGIAERLFTGFAHLAPWAARVAALGEGSRLPADVTAAGAAARASPPRAMPPAIVEADGLGVGDPVRVTPLDSCRGDVVGALAAASAMQISVDREWPGVGRVRVHFPRSGYRLERAAQAG